MCGRQQRAVPSCVGAIMLNALLLSDSKVNNILCGISHACMTRKKAYFGGAQRFTETFRWAAAVTRRLWLPQARRPYGLHRSINSRSAFSISFGMENDGYGTRECEYPIISWDYQGKDIFASLTPFVTPVHRGLAETKRHIFQLKQRRRPVRGVASDH